MIRRLKARFYFLLIPLVGVSFMSFSWEVIARALFLSLFFFLVFIRETPLSFSQKLKKICLPKYMVSVFFLTHLFLDSLGPQMARLWAQLKLKGFYYSGHLFKASKLGYVVGVLFLRSQKKALKAHQNLRLRGGEWES